MKVRVLMFVAALFVTSSIVAAESPDQNTSASDPTVFRLLPNYIKPEQTSRGRKYLEENRRDHIASADILARTEVMSELRLTDAQQSQIVSLFAAHAREVTELTADPLTVAGEAFLQHLDDLSTRRNATILNVLNSAQRKALDDIVERIRQKNRLKLPAPQVPEERLNEVGRIA